MWTSSKIKKHIAQLEKGQIFTTRDLLEYGLRNTVDQTLSRLARSGLIIRLARGVFTRNDFQKTLPTAFEVARAKASAFKKVIVQCGQNAWAALGLPETERRGADSSGSASATYAISGNSSRFWYGDLLIEFIGIAQRKLVLGDSKPGLALRVLWELKKDGCTQKMFDLVTSKLTPKEMKQLRKVAAVMPHWLSDLCLEKFRDPPPITPQPPDWIESLVRRP
ncbi:MAG TPA: DUF6088 family protein [Candidatus Obscuribacterales bacterium]